MVYEADPVTSNSHTLCVNSTSDVYYGLNTNKYKINIYSSSPCEVVCKKKTHVVIP